ncbi:hypothetical protein IB274_11955 [Pseudomonas sp. PDM18]|uniref:hypothetical protein n=1 Tax=unclassified Pseudomonas TaxID=196821 RepID=UPI00177F1464|nr:hypothetical protein [Pseudomonas sp. PDM18]MBD9677415.1 hypothetical protein [Pseudomonas sp. PDM18]
MKSLFECAGLLDDPTPRASNQARALLLNIFFNHGEAKSLRLDKAAAGTIPRIEKKQLKRHSEKRIKAIREQSPTWRKNGIDLALITGQRRSDILSMKLDDIRDGFLYAIQQKTVKVSDGAWIRFRPPPPSCRMYEIAATMVLPTS